MEKGVIKMSLRILVVFSLSYCLYGAHETDVYADDIDNKYSDQAAAVNHFNRGLARMERGTPEELFYAKAEFEFLLRPENDDRGLKPAAYLNLGVISVMENNPDMAVKNFLSAIQLKPDYAEAYFNLGGVYYKQKLLKKAEEVFVKAIELQPQYGRAHYALGFVYLDQKKYDLAKRHADKAAEFGVPYKTLREKLEKK